MRSHRLIVKIVACFLLVSVAIAISAGKTLYDKSIEQSENYMSDVALATAGLIRSVADFDRRYSADDHPLGAYGATLDQVAAALGQLPERHAIGEVLFLRYDGQDLEVFAQQDRSEGRRHSDRIDADTDYARAVKEARADTVRVTHVDDGSPLGAMIIAVAPVPELGGVVVVETDKARVLAPFVDAAVIGVIVAILVIAGATAFVFRQARRAAQEVSDAETVVIANLAELHSTKNQMEQIINTTPDGFVLYDAEDKLVFCNRRYEEFYWDHFGRTIKKGVSFEEILRAGISNGAYANAVGREEEWLRQQLEHHRNPKGPIEEKLADGRWLRVEKRKTDEGGTVGFLSDITELKEKESALRDSEERFRDFSETASDWAWETDAEHRFIYLSEGLEEGLTYLNEEAAGKTRIEIANEDTTTAKWQEHLSDLAARRPFSNFEYRIVDPEGKLRIVLASGKPVHDHDGVFTGYRGTGRDITDRRVQELELQRAELRFRRAFESITVGIVLSDQRGIMLRVNPETCRIFGYEERELVGNNVRMLMPEADAGNHNRYIENYLKTGEARIIGVGREVSGLRKNGEVFPMNLGITEVEIESDRQFLGSIVDLSKEKALESQLRQAQKMESVGQLVGGIAHDFNNILGIIIGNLDLAKRKLDQDDKLFRQVDKAVSAANRGASLTRRLLNFSRQTPIENAPIDVNDSIRNIHELLQRSITKNVEIKLSLEESLPNALADPGDFQDALVNLAVNARDAMPGGGVLRIGTRVIAISADGRKDLKQLPAGRYVEVDVADTGIGMPELVRQRVFDPFFTTKETGKGTGLGLPMVYGFAKRSGGAVTVYSEEGIGTSFKIYLPVAAGETAKDPSIQVEEHDRDLPRGTERILVVDDEEDLAEIAATMLSDLGYTVLVVNKGVDAMEVLIGDEPVDLMLSDVVMPGGVSGYELADAAAHLRPGMRVCLVSGFTGDLAETAIKPSESYAFLQKPYDNRTLALQVRALLDSKDTEPA